MMGYTRRGDCPVDKCDFVFDGEHYTLTLPHLETHTVKELANIVHQLIGNVNWADTMSREIVESCKTLILEEKDKK